MEEKKIVINGTATDNGKIYINSKDIARQLTGVDKVYSNNVIKFPGIYFDEEDDEHKIERLIPDNTKITKRRKIISLFKRGRNK